MNKYIPILMDLYKEMNTKNIECKETYNALKKKWDSVKKEDRLKTFWTEYEYYYTSVNPSFSDACMKDLLKIINQVSNRL